MPYYFLFLLLSTFVFSQEKSKYENYYLNIDQLSSDRQLILGDSLLKNAINDFDKTYALFYRAHTEMYADDYNESYSYLLKADSIIDINNFKKEKITVMNMLNGIYKNLKMYSNFYDNIQEIDRIVENAPKNDTYYIRVKGGNLLSLANYYSFINNYDQALMAYKKCIDYLEKNNIYTNTLVKAYNDLGMLYGEAKQSDLSNEIYEKMNAINTKYVNNKHFIMLYYLNVGVNYKLKKDYLKSKEYLEKGLELANSYNIEFYKSSLNEQLSIVYNHLGENIKSDLIEDEQLVKSKDVLNNKLQTNQLVTKKLNEVSKQKIEKSENSIKLILTILIVIFCLFLILIFYQIKKRRLIKKKFDEIIERYNAIESRDIEVETLKNTPIDFKEINLNISQQKEEEIFNSLINYEDSLKYLDKNVNLSKMSSELNTNIKYTSYILKKYRNNTFNGYINKLKIDYLIHNLINNPNFRKYKIEHLAEITGFSSHSRLTLVFKKEIGMSPSEFIKQINSAK